ncbi:hypothetical protein [Fastidiosibacter lacustris]|uniref:hypothetical protein n=1 Tax=Fastidiosibacter lacustris TaxID=2056695 RepID=UPI000E34D0B8|nr:hypothetical protein [Fastidiosibacter lacustris]
MLSQRQINEACQMLKRDGQEISIAKVRKLLQGHYSFFDVADKVLLFKENPDKARELAKKEVIIEDKRPNGLAYVIDQVLLTCALHEHKQITLNLKDKLQNFVDAEIKSKTHDYEHKLRKLRQKNDHLEVNFYSLQTRILQLIETQNVLKEQNYSLQQQLQKALAQKNYRLPEEQNTQKPAQIRDFQTQISFLKADCCAVYDIEKQRIVVKLPPKHKLEREFQKGLNSIYLRANAIYDFEMKCWFLDQFEAKTINLLVRNNFVISKELAYVLQKLQEQTTN